MGSSRSSWIRAAACAVALAMPAPALAQSAWIAPDGLRVRAHETPLASGVAPRVDRDGRIELAGLRGEVLSFQILVEAGDEPLEDVRVHVSVAQPERGGVEVDSFLEHYVEVTARSSNLERPAEALAWTPAARPPDASHLGWVPDALIPIDHAPSFCPYPFRVAPHRSTAVWVDLSIAPESAPGRVDGTVSVVSSSGELLRRSLTLDIVDATMPYRPIGFFAYYGTYELESRFGAEPWSVERQLWQLLHAHHVDAVPSGMVDVATLERVRPALDGSLFTEAHGYRGPGAGVPPGLVIVGPYGELGDPSDDGVRRVRELVARIPSSIEDVLLYAVDEKCDSPRGPGWRAALAEAGDPALDRVTVAHTCSHDPREQEVDLVMTTASTFDPLAARSPGAPVVWAYNGALPASGPMVLDAPLTSLTANGWIAASYGVPRWFFWETTFYNDDNPGGHGPTDPFTTAETFHNKDGDKMLYDGLLVFPGRQRGRLPESKNHDRAGELFEGLDAGFEGVFPSMRLKSLRRGAQDAGLYALARASDPEAADEIVRRVIPRAMSDVADDEPTPWQISPMALRDARDALRQLAAAGAALSPAEVKRALAGAPDALDRGKKGRGKNARWRAVIGGALLALLVAALFVDARRPRRPAE